jgi:hypothetical protein
MIMCLLWNFLWTFFLPCVFLNICRRLVVCRAFLGRPTTLAICRAPVRLAHGILPFSCSGAWQLKRCLYRSSMSAAMLRQKIRASKIVEVNLWICVCTTCSSILSVRPYITLVFNSASLNIYTGRLACLWNVYIYTVAPFVLSLPSLCNDRQVSCNRLFNFRTHSTLGKRNMAWTFASYQNVDDDESPLIGQKI